MSTDTVRMPSTGRRPALAPSTVEALLTRYFAEDKPSIEALSAEFQVTGSTGVTRNLSLATIRKYLKAAGIELPRGRAAALPRPQVSVRTVMNRIPTEMLIGEGRTDLLVRRVARGEPMSALAKEFGISKDRVARLRDRAFPKPSEPSAPAPVINHEAVGDMTLVETMDETPAETLSVVAELVAE
jgi:hypothetical protein